LIDPKHTGHIIKTDPDPTEAVKEALTLAIKNLDDKLTQRFDLNDRAIALAREEVKTATAELAKSQADALSAALKTTNDANTKLTDSFKSDSAATNEKIDRVIDRINIWTGRDSAVVDSKQERTTDKGQTLVLISVLIALAGLAFGVVTAIISRGH
jgi:hypothetical protein